MLVLGVAVYTMGEVAEGATKPAPSSWSLRGPGPGGGPALQDPFSFPTQLGPWQGQAAFSFFLLSCLPQHLHPAP